MFGFIKTPLFWFKLLNASEQGKVTQFCTRVMHAVLCYRSALHYVLVLLVFTTVWEYLLWNLLVEFYLYTTWLYANTSKMARFWCVFDTLLQAALCIVTCFRSFIGYLCFAAAKKRSTAKNALFERKEAHHQQNPQTAHQRIGEHGIQPQHISDVN